jgi:hypothetical protein
VREVHELAQALADVPLDPEALTDQLHVARRVP